MFYRVESTTSPALATGFVTRMLRRDLFAVAKLLVQQVIAISFVHKAFSSRMK